MKKAVLVTGATSQIGRFLLPQFSDGQFDVYAISRNNSNIDFDHNPHKFFPNAGIKNVL
jgi:short-subunit dehydrogenase